MWILPQSLTKLSLTLWTIEVFYVHFSSMTSLSFAPLWFRRLNRSCKFCLLVDNFVRFWSIESLLSMCLNFCCWVVLVCPDFATLACNIASDLMHERVWNLVSFNCICFKASELWMLWQHTLYLWIQVQSALSESYIPFALQHGKYILVPKLRKGLVLQSIRLHKFVPVIKWLWSTHEQGNGCF